MQKRKDMKMQGFKLTGKVVAVMYPILKAKKYTLVTKF